MTPSAVDPDVELADAVGEFYGDPLGFVRFAFPWGEPGPLEHELGPDQNQEAFLRDLGVEIKKRRFNGRDPVMPILMAIASGHGTGKSAMGAWLACFILSTRPHSIGTVTANTYQQLESRTWAQIQYWIKLCITAHWFVVQQRSVHHKEHPESWKIVAQTCKNKNAQAFAGQHARTSTSWFMFDEASCVPDAVWDVAQGGLTDGEPMFFAWGQPTRSIGKFYRITSGSEAARWNHRSIDSRTSRFANKELIAQWIEDYGEHSDYVRVRVFGLPPSSGDLQFIDSERVWEAQKRPAQSLADDALIAGVDVSGGGAAWNVVRFRRGLDARSIPAIRIPGEQTRDRSVLVGVLAEVLREQRPNRKVAAMFIDSAYGAAVFERLQNLGFRNVFEVGFGSVAPDVKHYANMRAFMWDRMKDWLLRGAIPDENCLELDLTGPCHDRNRNDQLVLEPKEKMIKRGLKSPDDGDALALTFARPVAPQIPQRVAPQRPPSGERSWMS